MTLSPVAKRLLRPLIKLRVLRTYRVSPRTQRREIVHYLLHDREITNFTYDLANRDELAAFLAGATGRPGEEVDALLTELEHDDDLRERLAVRLRRRRDRNDVPRFGRRLGWYCLARIVKPALAVETGTHDGLGSAVLLRALQRNAAEGAPGTLLSFDVDPASGWLVDEGLRAAYDLRLGDVRETLPAALAGRRVGLFVHDSLHTYEHERFELELALHHAADELALISDNARDSTALRDLCGRHGLRYHHFLERPAGHFYPGAALGLALYGRGAASAAAAATWAASSSGSSG